jgi:hypothetical protein
MKKYCPFTGLKKQCSEECALFTEEVRVYEDGKTGVIKGCVFVLGHEESRNQTQRLAMMQSEVGETKNATVFNALIGMGERSRGQENILRMARKIAPLQLEESSG